MGLMDVRQKGVLPREQLEDMMNRTKKLCVDCNTTKTPLWRPGPAGPKSLCNACGIRFRKRRISTNRARDSKKETPPPPPPPHPNNNNNNIGSSTVSATTTTNGEGEEDFGECTSLMMMMMPFREELVMVQNLPSLAKKQRCHRPRKLREEEEQAAVSLMALSCSSVHVCLRMKNKMEGT